MLANRPVSTVYRLPSSVYRQLTAYFRSGWAFLIPYLAVYLFYAWLRLPVNPVDGNQWSVVPPLLLLPWDSPVA